MRKVLSMSASSCLVLIGCVLLGAVQSPEASSALAVGAPSAQSDLGHALSAATHAGSAHITVEFFSGTTTGRVVQDSSARSGKQTVSIGKELASVVLVGHSAYISGNRTGLTSFFGLPSAMLPGLVGHWASVQPSDAVYSEVTANVTLASALKNVTPQGTLVEGKRSKVHGQQVKSISGEVPGGGGRLILFVTTKGKPLPVEAVETSGSGTTAKGEIVTFSHWGEKVHVSPPSQSVPFSALQAVAGAS
jgi:carbonic anhydrase/acetyltransferase-like protein (isoleucine patch superfamily)